MTLITITIAYFLGSIPFGLLLTRAAGLGDIRTIGSGNIGATNVMRTGNKKLGIATLLLDAGKGALAVWIATEILREAHLASDFYDRFKMMAGLLAVLGHVFPVWLKFKGGKGYATAMGVTFAFAWPLGLWMGAVWLTALAIGRIVSVASLASIWSLPVLIFFITNSGKSPIAYDIILTYLLMAALITWTHRANLKRIKAGNEPSLRKKS